MKDYKKTFVGSILAFILGTSCCWLTSLAIWVGGATLIGSLVSLIEDLQVVLISLGVILFIITAISYFKLRKK